uniref:Thioredoxin-like fold domain-containing protein n=1 Tax=Ditylenchus dipsaci TaxID=166011 RepID=A0A915E2V8_9BILA
MATDNNLNYVNVSNELSKASSKEQIPFIEVNGRQFADTNIIIDKLKDMYNLTIDQNLNSIEKAKARAIIVLIEESLFRCYVYNLSQNISWLASDNEDRIKQFQSGMKSRLHAQGYGRLSMEEITEATKNFFSETNHPL